MKNAFSATSGDSSSIGLLSVAVSRNTPSGFAGPRPCLPYGVLTSSHLRKRSEENFAKLLQPFLFTNVLTLKG